MRILNLTKNILGTICARGGSQGVKNKNIRELKGKPLIAYTIEQMKKWGKADKIICSTDSSEIASVAKQYGAEVPFTRPSELATGEAGKLPVIQHAVKFMEEKLGIKFDIIVDLDPTAPLRKIKFIEEAYSMLVENNLMSIYSVCKARKNPYYNMVELDENQVPYISKKPDKPLLRRQDAKIVYEVNASIYVYNRDFIMSSDSIQSPRTMIYEMPEEYSVDIDREIDYKYIEFLLNEGVVSID